MEVNGESSLLAREERWTNRTVKDYYQQLRSVKVLQLGIVACWMGSINDAVHNTSELAARLKLG